VPLSGLPFTMGGAVSVPDGSHGTIFAYVACGDGLERIYAQRIDATGSLLWQTGGVLVCATAGAQTCPAIAPDGAGGAIIVWSDVRDGEADIYAQRIDATGAAQWFADGIPICTAAGDQQHPEVIPDGGGAIVAWEDGRTYYTTSDIYVQKVSSAGVPQWNYEGVEVCTWPSGYPKLVSDGAGGAIISWTDRREGQDDIYAQRIDAAGAPQWTAEGLGICTLANPQQGHGVVSDGAGGAVVTWYDYRGGTYDVFAQRVGGSGAVRWTVNGIAVCAAAGNQSDPRSAWDGAGGVIVGWNDDRSGNDVYAQRVDTSGALSWAVYGVAVSAALGDQLNCRVAPDGTGGAIVAWDDWRSDAGDIYAQRIDASGDVQWEADGIPVCTAFWIQNVSLAITDEASGAIVFWGDYRDGTEAEIYAQRVDGSGNPLWPANGLATTTTGPEQYLASIVSDGAGGAVVAIEETRAGSEADIYAQRVDAFGDIRWTEGGVGIGTGASSQYQPIAVSDEAEGAIVVYHRLDSLGYSIQAQRISGAGALQWPAGGVNVCSSSDDRQVGQAIPDGSGGAIIAWTAYTGSEDSDIYVQRIDAAGNALWTASCGVPVCTTSGKQSDPALATDGSGGAIVSWSDYRDGVSSADIYAQRISAGGSVLWAEGGIPLCAATSNQVGSRAAADGSGGAIVVWQDYRSGMKSVDVYAQRVDASGLAVWTTNGVALTGTGAQNLPCISSDASGGAIVAWLDDRGVTGNNDVYAQRVNGAGVAQWAPYGTPIATYDAAMTYPEIVGDGTGGAIIAWRNRDVGLPYAQRVGADGTGQWAEFGVTIGIPVGSVTRLQIASDQGGGIVASLEIQRCEKRKTYVQRLNALGVVTDAGIPAASTALHQNYPNPFNPRTTIAFELLETAGITLDIYDVSGRFVARIAEGRWEGGHHEVVWDGRNAAGAPCTTGVYFCALRAGSQCLTRKMVLLQ
jgi:hypothetical protein